MKVINFYKLLSPLILFSLLGACGGSPPVLDAEDVALAAGGQTEYRIGPGDVLQVFVWRNPEISTTIPVRPDGKITTPLVTDMVAVGKTPSELAKDIEAVLAEYIRSPEVNIIVENFVGTFNAQIRVVGQAANPQAIAFKDQMTLLDVMIAVGGLGQFAAGNRAKIVRSRGEDTDEIPVRLDRLMNNGDMRYNVPMLPGDVVIIPESRF